MEAELPGKQYLKIGEVSRLINLNPSVLRFWETEFSVLKPHKSRSGQRLYSREDVELVVRIKELLYEEKLTISGARKKLHAFIPSDTVENPENNSVEENALRLLREVRAELKEIRGLLKN
jgi:DNA-binding transcriptional MerR regulator